MGNCFGSKCSDSDASSVNLSQCTKPSTLGMYVFFVFGLCLFVVCYLLFSGSLLFSRVSS